jgi:hypothetical protein
VLPPIPSNEPKRAAALHRPELLDTPPKPAFARWTRFAASALDLSIALISLINKAARVQIKLGLLSLREIPRDASFCPQANRCRRDAHACRCNSRSKILQQSFGWRRSALNRSLAADHAKLEGLSEAARSLESGNVEVAVPPIR